MDFLKEQQLNVMLIFIGICFSLTFLLSITKTVTRRRKFSLMNLEVTATLILITDRLAYIFRGDTSLLGWWMVRITNFSVFLFSLLILYFFNRYLIDLFSNEGGMTVMPKRIRTVKWLTAAGLILLIISQFTGLYYTFDSTNHYQRSSGQILCYLFPILIIICQVSVIIKYRKKFNSLLVMPLLAFTLVPIAATIVQIFFYGLSLTNLSMVFVVILLHGFSVMDINQAVEKAHKLEIEILERYKITLEKTVEERTHELRIANEKAEHLLLNILPANIARELSEHPDHTIAKEYPNVTVLFTDIVGFTKLSGKMTAEEIVHLLNKMVVLFDERAEKEGIEKIKTIGDAYMAATGLSEESSPEEAGRMIRFAQGLISDIEEINKNSPVKLKIRIGINTGNLVAGVIGKTKFIYDIWGDTVNVASRMESSGKAMRIHVSEQTYEQTKELFKYRKPVEMEIKGKGSMKTYFI
ncbi:adenylate/guanylate cyclase domain-containing protein [Treponema sp.]|uniref:adenylate/guanylate cyclase domain-containing protein n=1 Tax=Treponema sp. TaxID=166 RepID=UPI0025DB8255|nr:adenylate/guanylate cyclase domain-containing protein [Treponema sp.]MCR5219003.1 adenylate/guanylate cyclase domain-containing protein [Treponema sp.]